MSQIFFLNFFFILVTYTFFSLSLLGFGTFFNKYILRLKLNIGEKGILGFFFLYIISVTINFLSSLNIYITAFILFIGLIFFLKFFFRIKNQLKNITSLVIFILCLLTSITTNLHDDILLYQLPYIELKQNYKSIFGMVHLNDFLVYQHGLYDVMALFKMPFLGNRLIFLLPVIFLMFFLFSINYYLKISKKGIAFYLIFFILSLIFLKFTRSKEFGTDVPVILLIFYIQIYVLKFQKNNEINYFYKTLIFFILAVIFKIYAIIAIFYFLFFDRYIINFIKKILKKKKIILFITTFVILITITKNFIHSGCLNYPITKTCFDSNKIEWAIGKDFSKFRESHLKASIKGWLPYVRSTNFKDLIMPEDYLEKYKFSYHKNVALDPDIERIFITVSILFIIFLINIFYNHKDKLSINKNFFNLKILIYSFFPFIIWFVEFPYSRYGGYAYLSFFLILTMHYFFSFKLCSKKTFVSFLCLFVFYFSFKNLIRIKNEYNSSIKLNNASNFPIPSFEYIDFRVVDKGNTKFFISNHKMKCGQIPFPCLGNHYQEIDIKIKDYYGYKFISASGLNRIDFLKKEITFNDFMRGRPNYNKNMIVK